MSTTNTTPDLGNVISSGKARKIIYGCYAGAAVVVGGVAAYFLGTGAPEPTAVLGALAVVAYLGIPIGGLALANTSSTRVTNGGSV
jgi:hypothetical protein